MIWPWNLVCSRYNPSRSCSSPLSWSVNHRSRMVTSETTFLWIRVPCKELEVCWIDVIKNVCLWILLPLFYDSRVMMKLYLHHNMIQPCRNQSNHLGSLKQGENSPRRVYSLHSNPWKQCNCRRKTMFVQNPIYPKKLKKNPFVKIVSIGGREGVRQL